MCNLNLYLSQNIKDNLRETIFQQCAVAQVHPTVSDAIHCQPSDSRELRAEGPMKVLDVASSRPSSTGAVRHPPFGLSNGVQPHDGASGKGFHLRPPHPAPSNQFSYVQADQRRDIATPYSSVLHMQNGDNRSFPRDRNGMKATRHEIGESWMAPSHYSGKAFAILQYRVLQHSIFPLVLLLLVSFRSMLSRWLQRSLCYWIISCST